MLKLGLLPRSGFRAVQHCVGINQPTLLERRIIDLSQPQAHLSFLKE
jgi:hypothetical protein